MGAQTVEVTIYFDGTNNNKFRDEHVNSAADATIGAESNVARLFDAKQTYNTGSEITVRRLR